ncbi:MAG: hypothetical protein ACFB6R_17970 [Alphaproteobacteria bacterium]
MTASLETILLKKLDCTFFADTLRRHATYRRIAKDAMITMGLALPAAIGLYEVYQFWSGSLDAQHFITTMLALFAISFMVYVVSTFDFGESVLTNQSTAFADLSQTYTAMAESFMANAVGRSHVSKQVEVANQTFDILKRSVTPAVARADYPENIDPRRVLASPIGFLALSG